MVKAGAAEQSEVGLDVGATLAKIARRTPGDGADPHFELLPSSDLEVVASHVRGLWPTRVGLTGGGAAQLEDRLGCEAHRIGEFDAWGVGASHLLGGEGGTEGTRPAPGESFLLVSLGTGTSILLVDAPKTTRVGGTALGGGVVVGLGGAPAW